MWCPGPSAESGPPETKSATDLPVFRCQTQWFSPLWSRRWGRYAALPPCSRNSDTGVRPPSCGRSGLRRSWGIRRPNRSLRIEYKASSRVGSETECFALCSPNCCREQQAGPMKTHFSSFSASFPVLRPPAESLATQRPRTVGTIPQNHIGPAEPGNSFLRRALPIPAVPWLVAIGPSSWPHRGHGNVGPGRVACRRFRVLHPR